MKERTRILLAGKACNRGFSLLELIVVLFIIGIISSLVPIALSNSLSNTKLKTSSRKLASSLRYIRNQAISYKKDYALFIDTNNNRFFIQQLDKSESEPESILNLEEGLKIRLRENLEKISFSPLGTSSGGEIEIENDRGFSYIIHVDSLTGRVSSYPKE